MWIYNPTQAKYKITWGREDFIITPGVSEISKEVAQKYFLRFLPEEAMTPSNLEGLLKQSLRHFGKNIRIDGDKEFLDQFVVTQKREELDRFLKVGFSKK